MYSNVINIQVDHWAGIIQNQAINNINYPLDIERLVSITYPVAIVNIPQLRLFKIYDWLRKKAYPIQALNEDKSLHGFLIAWCGEGIIFIDGTDTLSERRFTIAHEFAHFFIEHYFPRQTAKLLLGESILEIIDGLRLPTLNEQMQGLIINYDLSRFTNLLEEESISGFARLNIWKAEMLADQLALELLAPYKLVFQDIRNCTDRSNQINVELLSGILIEKYGLPSSIAITYAKHLIKCYYGRPSVIEEWGIKIN